MYGTTGGPIFGEGYIPRHDVWNKTGNRCMSGFEIVPCCLWPLSSMASISVYSMVRCAPVVERRVPIGFRGQWHHCNQPYHLAVEPLLYLPYLTCGLLNHFWRGQSPWLHLCQIRYLWMRITADLEPHIGVCALSKCERESQSLCSMDDEALNWLETQTYKYLSRCRTPYSRCIISCSHR